jgi:hypothetical protein
MENTNTNTNAIEAIKPNETEGEIRARLLTLKITIATGANSSNEADFLRQAVLGDEEGVFTSKGLIAAGGRLQRAEMAVQIGRAVRVHLVSCGAASLKDDAGAALGLRTNGAWAPVATSADYAKVLQKVGTLERQPDTFEAIEESCQPEKTGKRQGAPRAQKSVELE